MCNDINRSWQQRERDDDDDDDDDDDGGPHEEQAHMKIRQVDDEN